MGNRPGNMLETLLQVSNFAKGFSEFASQGIPKFRTKTKLGLQAEDILLTRGDFLCEGLIAALDLSR